MNEINREQFEAWLFSQSRERKWAYLEGEAHQPTGCLLCNFLKDTGFKHYSIGGVTFDVGGDNQPLPEWFRKFLSVELTRSSLQTIGEAQDHYLLVYPHAFTQSDRVPLGQSNNQTTPEPAAPVHRAVSNVI